MTIKEDLKRLPTDALLARALHHSTDMSDCDTDTRWAHVVALHWRPEPKVFQAAKQWCRSAIAAERELGADVLGQLGVSTHPYADESTRVLWRLINDSAPEVAQSAIVALGHLGVSKGASRLAPAAAHSDSDVRHAVAYALGGSEEPAALSILIELSSDTDEEVRSWAVFGFGCLNTVDSPSIRDALLSRLEDAHNETRGEALLGLAIRKDERVVEPLINELSAKWVGMLAVEAARELADPRLLPALTALADWWDVDTQLLNDATEACKQQSN